MSAEALKAAIAKVMADTDLKDDQKSRKVELLKLENELEAQNAQLSGVGVRWFAAMTRGKGSQVIKYQGFDTSKPETCPTTVEQFVSVTGIKGNSDLTGLLIVGYNDQQYTESSDPIAEFVNAAWPDDTKLQFRTAVRTIAKMQEISIEDAVALVKPGTEKKFLASQCK